MTDREPWESFMNDVELTRFSAKAFGDVPIGFSPLTDDGDALRLAVVLSIRLTEFKDTVVKSRGVAWKDGYASCSLWEPEGTDPYAATRRAIVRAAASIGKAMP